MSLTKKLILYHTNWATYGRGFQVTDLPLASGHFDINYAFLDLKQNSHGFYVPVFSDPWADLDQPFDQGVKGNLGLFERERQRGRQFNLGLSIGGWTFSAHFSDAVASHDAREAFVTEILIILSRFPLLFAHIDLFVFLIS